MDRIIDVDVISGHSPSGAIRPLRMRMDLDGEIVVVPIRRLISAADERLVTCRYIVYRVEVQLYGFLRELTVKFDTGSLRWFVWV